MNKGTPKIYSISTSLVPRLIFVDTKAYNMVKMKKLLTTLDDVKRREKLIKLIGLFESTIKDYNNDIEDYYKRLKLLESRYELLND